MTEGSCQGLTVGRLLSGGGLTRRELSGDGLKGRELSGGGLKGREDWELPMVTGGSDFPTEREGEREMAVQRRVTSYYKQ